jgi:hypothetical protein
MVSTHFTGIHMQHVVKSGCADGTKEVYLVNCKANHTSTHVIQRPCACCVARVLRPPILASNANLRTAQGRHIL